MSSLTFTTPDGLPLRLPDKTLSHSLHPSIHTRTSTDPAQIPLPKTHSLHRTPIIQITNNRMSPATTREHEASVGTEIPEVSVTQERRPFLQDDENVSLVHAGMSNPSPKTGVSAND